MTTPKWVMGSCILNRVGTSVGILDLLRPGAAWRDSDKTDPLLQGVWEALGVLKAVGV